MVSYAVIVRHLVRSAIVLATVLVGVAVPGLARAQLPFGPTVNVSGTGGDSRQPHMVLDPAGTLHIAWADDTGSPGNYRILYKRSFDRGQTFTDAIQLSSGGGAALRPRLAVRGGAVYLVWHEDVSATKDIMFSRSLNGGASFESPINISNTPGQSMEGRIAVGPSGTIFVVWDEASPFRRIALSRSFDGGSSFESPQTVFGVAMPGDCRPGQPTGACTPYPGIAIDPASGRVYLVWHDLVDGNAQVLVSRSLDGGSSFSAPLKISHGVFHSHCAAITVGPSGKILVAYENRKQIEPHAHDAMFTQSVDGGASFSPPVNLSNGPDFAFSDYPWPVEAPNGMIVVGWEDNRAGGELDAVLATSTDGGRTFSQSQNLLNNDTSPSTEVVTLFGPDGTLYVAWEDYQNGQAEVFLRTAVGVGRVATPPAKLLATGAGLGGGPHVRVFMVTGGTVREITGFMAYHPGFTGGVSVALGDFDRDGVPEIVTGAGPGGGPHVRIFKVNPATGEATPLGTGFMAYDPAFRGGVRVAVQDVDGDGVPEIVASPGAGGGPHVRIFKIDPASGNATAIGPEFFAYDPGFTGGVSVAAE